MLCPLHQDLDGLYGYGHLKFKRPVGVALLTNISSRILPSVTFIPAEGFETAECNLIPCPLLSEVGNQPCISHLCTTHSAGRWDTEGA